MAVCYVVSVETSARNSISDQHRYKELHIRGNWVCYQCDTLIQEPISVYVIDKGIAIPQLLSRVLVSKYTDHLPLYSQHLIYQHDGVDFARSTLSE